MLSISLTRVSFHSSGKSGSKSSSGGSANAVFPAGSYSFDT